MSYKAKRKDEGGEKGYNKTRKEKPAGLKGNYIKNIFVTNTMGPSVKLNLAN